jgi:RNA polymerase sigma-70 factor, ECF subfamily
MSRAPLSSSPASPPPGGHGMRIAGAAPSPEKQAEWFGLARRGDRSAFAKLVQATQDRLFNAVTRMVAQPADALEVTQETYAKALEGIGEFRGESQPYTWLFRIAMNCAISRRRKEHVRRSLSIDAERRVDGEDQMSSLRARIASSGPTPVEAAEKRETAEQVRIALSRLEPEERALLVMRDVDDMDYAAMAEVLEVPLGTLKSRLFRARGALRQQMEALDVK